MREVLIKTEEFKDSPLGNIPKDWDVVTLGLLFQIQAGATPLRTKHQSYFAGGTIPWIKTMDLNEGWILDSDEKITEVALKECSVQMLPPKTVLIAMYGGWEQIGRTGILKYPATTNQAISSLVKISSLVESEFVIRALQHGRIRWKGLAASTRKDPNITKDDVVNFLIPLPSLPEQRHIAEILDTVDEAIARTSSLIIKLKQTKAGLLQDLLTRGLDENGKLRDPEAHPEQFKDLALGRIPQKWTVKEFGEYIAHLDSGWSPICEAEPVANGEWGVLKTTAVVWSGYNPSESKKLPSNLEPRYSSVVETDDILITRKGPRERVGVVVHIPSTPANLMMPDTVFRVRLKESSPLLPAFIPLTLGSVAVQQDWNRKKVGLAEAQVDINYGIVRETIIYIPPKSEQKYIIQILNTYDTRIRTEEAYLNKLKLQKQGLMQDLLTGKVRVSTIR